MNLHDVIQQPLVTEKSAIAREERNIATFRVDPAASKHEIRRAVEELFDVKVTRVRTMQQPGKKRRVGKIVGRRPRWKKAIVELAEGQTIEFFEGV
ncbi:MAG: 50S ribosomal protein L23 [Deltaproteobacteria bacterium]|jgi:large subunit ribosomal protein L23|nr:50S ribosomal protein L23 [Deltaproteobacteria bacterium]MBW2499553.1 50S ribosomal protein L23 [Deltaproteobacteria bacterium]